MNRRTFVVALVAVFAGLVVGISPAMAQDKVKIGVSIPAATHGWPAGVGWWAERTMKEFDNIEWVYQRASNAAEQAGQIDAMVAKGVRALVVLPFDSDTPLGAIEKAKQQGVYIVSVDRGLRRPVADVYLAGDNKSFGRKSAQYMVERLGTQAGDKPFKIVILRGMPVEIDTERYEAAMAVFNAHRELVTVLDAQPGNWNRQDAHRITQDFLTKYPDVDAVWASDDDMALGVEQAVREAGRQDQLWIVGGAGMKDIVKRVADKDPLFPADITYPPGMIGAGIVLGVAGATDGNEKALADKIPAHLRVSPDQLVEKTPADGTQRPIVLDVQLVTPENASEFYFPESVY